MKTRPNFVFILADDLGYADLGCYGGRMKCSPIIDRLGAVDYFKHGFRGSPLRAFVVPTRCSSSSDPDRGLHKTVLATRDSPLSGVRL